VNGNAGGRNQAIAAAMMEVREDDCDQDMLRIAESMPALYWGVRRFGKHSLETAFALDIDDRTAAALTKLAGPIPGLAKDRDRGETLAAGVGFDFAGVQPLFDILGDAVRERPFVCESLSGLNELADAAALLHAVPDEFRAFTGMSAVVNDLESLERGDPPAYAVVGLEDPLKALSGPVANSLDLVPDALKRGRVTQLADAAPGIGSGDILDQAKVTRGAHGIAIGNRSTPDATLLKAVDRRRPSDGTMMMLRWDAAQWYAANRKATELDDIGPVAQELAEAMISSLLRGSLALRANRSGLVLDVSLARPRRATANRGSGDSAP